MRTLLLADDSVTVQRVIALTFAEEPIRVVTVADGQQAMEKIAAQRPDIVLAGTTLPQVSGYDLARFMRSKAELRAVPVLLLSGAFETVDPARLTSSGANGVLEKPVEPTIVIGRVRELLGMKGDARPAAGRMVTPADAPASRGGEAAPERKMPVPVPPRAVTSTRGTPSRWEQLRNQTGLEPNTRSVEDASSRPDDYLDTLDAAFDTLDQQLSGRIPAKAQRNPAGPLGQSPGAGDPRSPGRTPPNAAPPATGNAVYEVDDEWFGGTETPSRAHADTVRSDLHEDLHDPELRAPQRSTPANPIYEVDDEWFAEDEKARAQRLVEQKHLAAEMGIHDVELPEASPAIVHTAAPVIADLDFSVDDLARIQATAVPEVTVPPAPSPATPAAPRPAQPPHAAPPVVSVAPLPAILQPLAPPIVPMPRLAPVDPAHASVIADDFAALLAFEQGERPHPPTFAPADAGERRRDEPAPPPEIKVVAPEITEDMLDQIASRVAERLSASTFGDRLKDTMSATLRDTVRMVVSETSERLVREEIERIKSRKSQ